MRFSEIDSLGILWHGHYVKYFEDGRESFGRDFKLGYMDVYAEGYSTPIVKLDCNYKKPVRYNDRIRVETFFIDSPAAKIIFDYRIVNIESDELLATGRTEQVFLNRDYELSLTIPEFYQVWKKRNGLPA